jgi:outer membrane lipoprotein SlyB
MKLAASLLIVTLVLAGCGGPSSTKYNSTDVGTPIETTEGTVVSSRVVDVSGDATPVGAVGGGAVGAASSGILFGGGAPALLGGLLGAGAGYLAEKRVKSGEGIEYIVEMADGRTVTMVQNREDEEQPLADGTPVLVQVGSRYSRIIEHPRAEGGGATGIPQDWVDPDTIDEDGLPAPPDQQPSVPQQ